MKTTILILTLLFFFGFAKASSYPESDFEALSHFFSIAVKEAPSDGLILYTTGKNRPAEDPDAFYSLITKCEYEKVRSRTLRGKPSRDSKQGMQ